VSWCRSPAGSETASRRSLRRCVAVENSGITRIHDRDQGRAAMSAAETAAGAERDPTCDVEGSLPGCRTRSPRVVRSTSSVHGARLNVRACLVMSPLVPMVVEQDTRGERASDLYSHLLRVRSSFWVRRSTTRSRT
jgi:hypothetical protein